MLLTIFERLGEHAEPLRSKRLHPSTLDPRTQARERRAVHHDDDTIRRVRTVLLAGTLLVTACAPAVSVPRQPFDDIPVPVEWVPYSRDSVIVQTPKVTTAKLIYFSENKVDATLEQARELLIRTGWTETKSERFVNPEKFPGVWAEFTKGDDICRVTVIQGSYATHVDYTVARVTPLPR
jgi:hypothetical protein